MFGVLLDDYTSASLLATTIIAFPLLLANKHFVWRISSRERLHSQVLVFWATTLLGLLLATALTYLAEHATRGEPMVVRGATVFVAQLVSLGIVWIGRFAILDRWLFTVEAGTSPRAATSDEAQP